MNRPNTRTQWLTALAKLTSPSHSAETAHAFAAYVPLLTALPDAAFTADSLEYVAARCTHGVPTYATMREHLTTHWRENRPPTLAITDNTELDQNARLWIKYFHTREAEAFCPLANGRPSSRAHVLSLVKQQSPTAWQHLTGLTPDRSKPYQHPTTPERRSPTTDELQAVASIVSQGVADIDAHFDATYAPRPKPAP